MNDVYPVLSTLPGDALVPVELQPQYVEAPGVHVDATANVALAILAGGDHDAVAVVHHESGRELTFGDLDEASARVANLLEALGIHVGDRVAIRSPNRPEALIAAIGAWRAGAVVVPTPAAARPSELQFLLRDTGARVLVAFGSDPEFTDAQAGSDDTDVEVKIVFGSAEAPPGWVSWDYATDVASPTHTPTPLPPNLPALIWHTGGTTGVPKACYHTHRRYLLAGATFAQATACRPGMRWAAAAPVGHALGLLCHTTFTLLRGATVVMVEQFAKADVILTAIRQHRIHTFIGITMTWAQMLDAMTSDPDLDQVGSLQRGYAMWQSASSGAVYDGWKARGVELQNNFGSTAFANWILIPRESDRVPRASLGRPTPGYDVRAVDADQTTFERLPTGSIGRMAVQGPTGLTYWNRPAQQERDVVGGWTMVDDLISFDANGNAEYLGRSDYIISSAGFKIAPVEVEAALSQHPAVAEVGVIGAPDPIRSEIVTAFVVLAHDRSPGVELTRELQDYIKATLSPYKYPRRIEFVDALPRDHVGKLQPRVLKQWAEEPSATPSQETDRGGA